MNKTPSKPTTKQSYAMPNIQVQTPYCFEVLGKIPKLSIPSSFTLVYQTKEVKSLIQIVKVDHIFASRNFDLKKIKKKNILNQMMF